MRENVDSEGIEVVKNLLRISRWSMAIPPLRSDESPLSSSLFVPINDNSQEILPG